MDLPLGLAAGIAQGVEKLLLVGAIAKNILAIISPIHEVVDRSGISNAQLARHEPPVLTRSPTANSEN
jgi:hypothetical protein